MIAALLASALLQTAPAPASAAAAELEAAVIVVTATRRGRCRVQLAQRILSASEFAAHAREWGALGRPVSVVRPAGASYRCLARIVLRLRDSGVQLVHFADPADGR